MVTIAHMSDLHVRRRGELALGRVDSNRMLQSAVTKIRKLDPPPDAVVITGDLADQGLKEEYAMIKEILESIWEITYFVPGNHDDRDAIREVFTDERYLCGDEGFIYYAVDHLPIRLIGLDSVVQGASHGEICENQLEWLAREIAKDVDRPTILFMHHPPFNSGIRALDGDVCRNSDKLERVMSKNAELVQILCGHQHRHIHVVWKGIPCCISPSTAHHVHLDFLTRSEMSFTLEPPGFLLHYLEAEHELVTHVVYTGDYSGPFRLSDPGRSENGMST